MTKLTSYLVLRAENTPTLSELEDELQRMRAEMLDSGNDPYGRFTLLCPARRIAGKGLREVASVRRNMLARKRANMRARMMRKREA